MKYEQLLQTKRKRHIDAGFDVEGKWPHLFPFQRYCVKTALKKGRFAMFEDCGLGKTWQQLVWANEVVKYTGKAVIIFAPLAVVGQTINVGVLAGVQVIEWCDGMEQSHELAHAVYITNYEQLEHIPVDLFAGCVLDESSILKNHEGAYRNMLIDYFRDTQYKLCCTATPSPNDPMELGNHAEFLGVMSRNEMLAMYFVHDGGDTAKWRLKGHCEQLFWEWVSTWAIMLSKPSDIGYSNDGYNLPQLNYIERTIITAKRDNGLLFNDTPVSATNHNAELRGTYDERMQAAADVANSTTENYIIWIKHDEEGRMLRNLIPDAVEVKGSDTAEFKKRTLLGFADNKFRVLITKAKIGMFGLNYQNCRNQIFPSLDFSFEALYQAIRRSWRFGQTLPVNVYLIVPDTMLNVRTSLKTKQTSHEKMQKAMQKAMNSAFEHNNQIETYKRRELTHKTENADIRLGDSIQLIDTLPDESIGFSMWSPPFPELYVYSDQMEDLGNCKNYQEFRQFFSFIPPKLFRVMWSGRNVAIHCMDTPIQKGKDGYIGLRDFSGMIREEMEKAGFIYHSRVTIWKNPVTEMQRTKALGLLHKQVKKDAAMSRVCIPDYLLVFRKPGEHKHPIKCKIPVDVWQQYASPVWMDIDYGDTLNGRAAREERDEKHICPLQLPTIERATILWSNENDPCLSMFGGVGSEPFKWLQMKRKAVAFELKESYYNQMVKNAKAAEELKAQAELFV